MSNEIKPSRELDKRIAVEVMGLEVVGEDTVAYYTGVGVILPGDDPASHSVFATVEPLYVKKCHCDWLTESDKAEGGIRKEYKTCGHYTDCLEVVPRYSKDKCAWLDVVEKMMQRGYRYVMRGNFQGNGLHRCGFDEQEWADMNPLYQSPAVESLPLGICLAARKAVAKDAGEG